MKKPPVEPPESWDLVLTAHFVRTILADEMYSDIDECLWEVVRNGIAACMPESHWRPERAHLELSLENNHPLAPKMQSLVILDHGRGFTQPAIERYRHLGRSMEDNRQTKQSKNLGVSQKRIGRFATFALTKKGQELPEEARFFILTRTSAEGQVKCIDVKAEYFETRKALTPEWLNSDSTELGALRGIRGSFTAIVIPDPVFTNHESIRRALQWRIPRKQNLTVGLLIGGKQLFPPKLANQVLIQQQDGPIEVYINKLPSDTPTKERGVWITDAETGLRVALARSIPTAYIPDILLRDDLGGDIFAPNVLANQNTSRAGLLPRFLDSRDWKNTGLFLATQAAPDVVKLMGENESISNNPASKTIKNIAEMFNTVWGEAKITCDGPGIEIEGEGPRKRERGRPKDKDGEDGKEGRKKWPRRLTVDPPNGNPLRKRLEPIRIQDEVYFLAARPLGSNVLASVDSVNGKYIYINTTDYGAWPKRNEARDEHLVMSVFWAVGRTKFRDLPDEVARYAADLRRELLGRK